MSSTSLRVPARLRVPTRPRVPAGLRAPTRPNVPSRLHVATAGLLMVGMWLLVLANLTVIFGWGQWFVRAVVIVSIGLGAATLLRTLWPRLRAAAAVIGALCGLGCWAWWFTGTPRPAAWWSEPMVMLDTIRRQIVEGAAPLTTSGPLEDVLLLIVALAVTVTALVLIGLWHPVLAGGGTAVLLLIPSAVTGVSVGWPAMLGASVVVGLLVWVGSPIPNLAGVVAVLVAVAVAATVMAVVPVTRDRIWNDAFMAGPVDAAVPDVTITLAEDLRQRSDAEAFRFTSTDPGPQRFTLATLSAFTQGRWEPDDALNTGGLTVETPRSPEPVFPEPVSPEPVSPEPVSPEATSDLADPSSEHRTVSVTIEGLLSAWLPLPQSTVRVLQPGAGFDPAQWQWTAHSSTARAEGTITRREHQYSAEAQNLVEKRLAATTLDGALVTDSATAPDDLAQYLELPDQLPQTLADAAATVAGDAQDRLGAAEALQDWFRSDAFSYDESAPYQPGMDTDDPYAVMEALLAERRGFCVHYASTFAVMARHLGVPTRVAVGYAAQADRGEETTVRGTELHAWPEVYVDNVGWVAFEPTPGGAGLRADTGEDVPAVPDDADVDDDAMTPTPATPEPPPEDTDPVDEREPGSAADEGATDASQVRAIIPWAGAGVLLLLMLAPMIVRNVRSLYRGREIARGRRPASHAWREFTDTAEDLGFVSRDDHARSAPDGGSPRPRARTPEAMVEYLDARGIFSTASRDAARAIADAMAAERYSASAASGRAHSQAAPGQARSFAGSVGEGSTAPSTEVDPSLGTEVDPSLSTEVDASNGTEIRAHLDTVLEALRRSAGRRARIRAAWLPKSVLQTSARSWSVLSGSAR